MLKESLPLLLGKLLLKQSMVVTVENKEIMEKNNKMIKQHILGFLSLAYFTASGAGGSLEMSLAGTISMATLAKDDKNAGPGF